MVDPGGGFGLQSVLGRLYQSPQLGANTAFYGCKQGSMDYFVSLAALVRVSELSASLGMDILSLSLDRI
jgi:hypothetical protein